MKVREFFAILKYQEKKTRNVSEIQLKEFQYKSYLRVFRVSKKYSLPERQAALLLLLEHHAEAQEQERAAALDVCE